MLLNIFMDRRSREGITTDIKRRTHTSGYNYVLGYAYCWFFHTKARPINTEYE